MNKVVVITGASSGIGLATAKRLSKDGCKVYGISKDDFKSEEFSNYQMDVNNIDSIEKILEEIFNKEGRIDVVINNAGFGIAGAIEYATKEKIQALFDTNLTAVVKISSLALKYLKKSKGNLINTSSVAGVTPIPFQACYSASKAGVLNFSLALDGEVRRFGVKVTAILPGDTKTGFTQARVTEGGDGGYGKAVSSSIRRMAKDEQCGKSPDTVAKVVEKVLKKKQPPLKVTVGGSYKLLVGLAKIMPTRFVNYILRKMYA